MSSKYHYLTFLMVFALFLSGCANSIPDTPAPAEIPAEATPDRGEIRPTQALPSGLETVEIPTSVPVTGEVPKEILDQIIADLVKRTGAERDGILVVRAETVVWNDGSLGCAKPGEFYIQMLIKGYWVVLEVEGVEYDYRVSDKGYFTLCEGRGGLPISPPENPGIDPAPDQ